MELVKIEQVIKQLLEARGGVHPRAVRNTLSWEDTELAIRMAWDFGEIIFPNYRKLYLLEGEYRLQAVEFINLLNRGQCVSRVDLRSFQRMLEAHINSPLEIEVREFLEILVGQPLVWSAGGMLARQEDCIWSELTREYYLDSDPDLVWVRCRHFDDQPLLEQEADIFAFWCSASHEYYCRQDFECIEVEGETFAASYIADEVFQWSDGTYHWEPEPNLGLRQYHEGFRPLPKSGQRLSLELEVEVGSVDPTFGDEVRSVWDEAEEDISLGPKGAELIVGFIGLDEVEEKIHGICQILDRYDCSVPDDGYGFHVSASIRGWGLSEEQVEKLAKVFYSNYELVCRVANRQPNRYCRWQQLDRLDISRSKYYALRRDGDRLEFRIFRASVQPEHLLRCVEFVASLLNYVVSNTEGEFTFGE